MSKAMKAANAFAALQEAAEKFNKAIEKFQSVYDPESVGLDEWIDYNEEVLSDIEGDIDSTFGDEE